ncbi:uncharacterized protein LOC135493985 [Lineus longissimus]|uniref:uncharacterized protein LOC135493985 n=1 Tax=Lineus longissimus TaxID=88925 RepID=UPI00315D1D69
MDESNKREVVRLRNMVVDKWGQDTSLQNTLETELEGVPNVEENVVITILAKHDRDLLVMKTEGDNAEEFTIRDGIFVPVLLDFPVEVNVSIDGKVVTEFHE